MIAKQRRSKRQKVPSWSWRGLVLVRHVSWPTASLTWSMKKWSILGIFWPLPLPIKPLGRWRSGLISWIQPLKIAWLPPSTPCVCVSSVEMRIILDTIAILPLSIQVSNGPWWSGSWSPWIWIQKNGMNGPFWGLFPMPKMTWSMKWPMLPRLAICIPRSLLSVMRLTKRNSVSQKQWTLMIWSCWHCVFLISIQMYWPITSRSSNTSTWMSTKIPTMPNTSWSNSWLHVLKISVSWGMLTSLFTAGGERICRISWTLKRIILMPRSSS